ncbi:MAG TPA: PAS-domain containing protein, partial [Acetobacteraceae bacterium]|nr:PAS-domain containing protein [Acetobacteraceae bacterium]
MALAALRPFASWRARPRGSIRKLGASLWQALLAAVLVVAMVAVVAGILIRQRASTLAATQAEAEGLAHALAGEAGQALAAVDRAVAAASAQVDALDAADPAHLRTALRSLRLQESLANLVANQPPATSVALLAADGHLVSTSRIWPAPLSDAWHRPLFLALRARHGSAPAIELPPPPAAGRGARSIYLARRVEDRGGHLLAIATGALSLPYFQSFYRAVAQRGQSVVAVYRTDGTLLFCYPRRAQAPLARWSQMPRLATGSPWFAAVAAGGGAFEQSGPGQPTRIMAVQPVAAYPVVVEVGFSEPVALAAWRRQAIFAGIAFAIAVLGVGVLLRNLLGQFRRLEHRTLELGRTAAALSASEARLAEKSALLETTLEQMDQGIMMIDAGRRVGLCSQRARDLLELPAALMEGRPLFDEVLQYQVAHQEFVSADVPMQSLLRRGGYLDKPHAYERQRPNGMVIEVRTVPLPGGGAVRTYTDITARRAAEARLRFFAHHDELTRLANRMLLHRELNARAAVVMEEGAHGR